MLGLPGGFSGGGSDGVPGVAGGISGGSIGIYSAPLRPVTALIGRARNLSPSRVTSIAKPIFFMSP
jgi:hypothetical protein